MKINKILLKHISSMFCFPDDCFCLVGVIHLECVFDLKFKIICIKMINLVLFKHIFLII